MRRRVLVTGADGCLGAWVVKLLAAQGDHPVLFDIGVDIHRHELLTPGASEGHERVVGDICDPRALVAAADGADAIIHLAALQVPFCRANPRRGAAVNVEGTVNVFEAALAAQVPSVVYASSIAVYGAPERYDSATLPADAPRAPETLYGVYKCANEDTARVYFQDHGLASIGLRPHTVFGPGRDQGMTSQPTVAIERAVRQEPYAVEYGGVLDFQFAPDVAADLIAAAAAKPDGARVNNLVGHVVAVGDFVAEVRAVTGFGDISAGTGELPLPAGAEAGDLAVLIGERAPTPLTEAIEQTVAYFAEAESEPTPSQEQRL